MFVFFSHKKTWGEAFTVECIFLRSMYDVFTYIWLIFVVNVGKHIPYIDCPGNGVVGRNGHFFKWKIWNQVIQSDLYIL